MLAVIVMQQQAHKKAADSKFSCNWNTHGDLELLRANRTLQLQVGK
jgi:hypothetical protein